MAILESDKGRCGECSFFDIKGVDKISFGTEQLSTGEEVTLGVCRVNNGLVLGVLNEQTSCKQLPGTFSPILETAGASQNT